MDSVRIFYTRPPGAAQIFDQAVVLDTPEVIITLGVDLAIPSAKVIDGRVAMEPGGSIVWFTFPGLWHDIGKSYLRDDSFAGTYANVLTPVRIEEGGVWHTTDLCLDVWLPPNGEPARLLDEDALAQALREGSISREWGARATTEAAALLIGAQRGSWPPQVVAEWDLERARAATRR